MLRAYTNLASRLYLHRWWFAGITAAVFLALLLLTFTRFSSTVDFAFLISGPVIAISWGLHLMCVWFHPTLGTMYSGRLFMRMPAMVQGFVRWYSAVFLSIWFVFGVLVWPTFGLSSMGLTTRWSGP
jgi:hypothetical protein